jgi:hypothetical protein
VPPAQFELRQSAETEHDEPSAHAPHVPPQSTSDSVPFFTPSEHEGTWQTFDVQTPLWQSAGTAHPLVSAHGEHAPPQSTSVSVPFLVPSVQPGAWHTLVAQTPL